MKFLFKLSGSIACYKACEVISRLVKAGHEVQTVTTAVSLRFIGPATLEGLTGRPNLSDLWSVGEQMAHLRLPEWADAVVHCPASANSLSRMAGGLGDDLLTTLFLAHDFTKPYYVAPAMNSRMLKHPATVAAIEKLAGWGVRILPTGEGVLACRDVGPGRLLEPERIFGLITADEPLTPSVRWRVLITAGGTEEPIDSVRVITNLSSGRTGAFLADNFARRGAAVTLLRGRRSQASYLPNVRQRVYGSAADLTALLRDELGASPFDLVVHAAAVSDYTVDPPKGVGNASKLSSGEILHLTLRPAPKLLPSIKEWSAPHRSPRLVGFKLTDEFDSPAPEDPVHPARRLLENSGADVIVHNARASIGTDSGLHPSRLYSPDAPIRGCATKEELAEAIWDFVSSPVTG